LVVASTSQVIGYEDHFLRQSVLLGFAQSFEHLCVFGLHGAIYIFFKKNLLTSFSLPFNELSLVRLALDMVD